MVKRAVSADPPAGPAFYQQMLHLMLTLAAVVALLAWVGWSGAVATWQHWLTVAIGMAFAAERMWIFKETCSHGKVRLRPCAQLVLGLTVGAVAAILASQHRAAYGAWPIGWHAFVQCSVLISGLSSIVRHQARFTARALHPGWLLMGSFTAAILLGTLLLKMPRCVVDGAHLSWLDAAFTSTSAVCVTGLVVENTATFFSPVGQIIILILIQIGGLGIMTLTFFAAVVLFEGLSFHDRLLLGKVIQENRLSRINKTLAFIVVMTLVFEGVGTLVLFQGMGAAVPFNERLFQSVFHAVSAFCNAGFSTLPDGLACTSIHGNLTWQICIMSLVVVGGLGALVVEDFSQWLVAKCRSRKRMDFPKPRLRVHTRLVLAVTAGLVIGGALATYITEFISADGPQNGGRVLTALFHSVTARSAGFNAVAMDSLAPLTVEVLMMLMIIGGSPGGTAGGLRTTVVAVGFGHLWLQLRAGRRGMVLFNRTIPQETGARALGLLVLAGLWLAVNFIVLKHIETGGSISEFRLLFELISSFATVGLSLDVTAALSDGGKALIIVNMFVGRIGLLAVLATLLPRDLRPPSGKPGEDIQLT